MSFASMHNDYLDPDRYNNYLDPDQQDESPEGCWVLYRFDSGEKTRLGEYSPEDGRDVMGCDMHDWMKEQGHYGPHDPEEYDWDGDRDSVAIMAKEKGLPDFAFVWEES